MLTEFNYFFYPNEEDVERKENVQANIRHNTRVSAMIDIIRNKLSINNADINDPDYHQDLVSFTGQTLDGDERKLLESYEIGIQKYKEFVEERIIKREKHFNDTIKKTGTPVFKLKNEKVEKLVRKANTEKDEFRLFSKLLKICIDRPHLNSETITSYQLTNHNALVDANDQCVSPLIRSDKSSAFKDFLLKKAPLCNSKFEPSEVDIAIIEGENLIHQIVGQGKTVSEYALSIFKFTITPFFR